jgi:hypothetical protein
MKVLNIRYFTKIGIEDTTFKAHGYLLAIQLKGKGYAW